MAHTALQSSIVSNCALSAVQFAMMAPQYPSHESAVGPVPPEPPDVELDAPVAPVEAPVDGFPELAVSLSVLQSLSPSLSIPLHSSSLSSSPLLQAVNPMAEDVASAMTRP